jgi:integrase
MKVLKTKHPGIYQIGPNYYIDFYADGKRHRKVVGPKLDMAVEEKSEMRKKNKHGKYHIIERMEKTTFKELMELYKKEKDQKTYILQFEKVYLDYFGNRKLANITRSDLFKFKDKVGTTPKERGHACVTDSTVNRALAGLRRLFHFAMSKEYLEESPFPKDPKSGLFLSEKGNRGKRKYFTEDEVKKIIEACPYWLRPIVITAYLTGMRAGEILKLKWKDVNLKEGEILLEETKAGEPQVVKMQDELIDLFKSLPKRSEFIFSQDNGEPLKDWHYYKPFKEALNSIGKNEKGWNFHTLRHTTGTQLYLKGVPVIAIKDQLRHSDIRVTTDYYVGCDSEYQKAQIEKLSKGYFREFLTGSEVNSEKTVKKEVKFEALQEVPPFASA